MRLLQLTFFTLLIAPSPAPCEADRCASTPEEQWEAGPAEFIARRWDRGKLNEVEAHWEAMREKKTSTALVVVDSGFVVLQLGAVEQPIKCHSVRKSLLNALFGKLHANAELDLDLTLDELGIDDLTQLNAEEKKATIRHLMQCRSGVYLPAEAETKSMREKKPARGSHPAGSYYYYNNWDFNALGGIYRELAGSDIFLDFAAEIASPIGMQDFDHKRDPYYWHDDDEDRQSAFPAYHFRMSARDRARFGLLFLRKGKWGDQQVIADEWIKLSTTAYSNHQSDPEQLGSGKGYGLLWWVSDTGWLYGQEFDGQPFSARGNGGQFIAIIPAENLVIAAANDTSIEGWKSSGKQRNKLIELIAAAKK